MPSFSWPLVEPSSSVTSPAADASSSAQVGRDLALDEGDLLIEDGDLQLVSGIESVGQDAECRLRFVRGEWFLDRTVGVPYFDEIFVKAPDLARVRALYVAELLATPGITEVVEFTLALDSATRRLSGAFRATSDIGAIVGAIGATP